MSLEAAAVTIRGLLFADVFADLLQLKAHRGHCVSTGPEVLAREIPLFATQAGHRYGALPFQKSDHEGHRILRRDRDAHVHMVRQQVSLNDLALLLPRQCAKYFITSSFFWLSPSHGGCYAQTERSNLFWSHWSNQWLT